MSTNNESKSIESYDTEKQIEMDKMREILTSIASEMQRFHDSTLESDSEVAVPRLKEKQNVFGELLKCKSKIRSKRMCIKNLRKNLETACSVAKIVACAKEKESGCLKKSLGSQQNDLTELTEKLQSNKRVTNNLTRENELLNNKLDNVKNFIRLGYEELQKIRKEPADETSVLEQLRQLIICCGQYYADFCNEHDECLRLKQKNNFLKNKSQILENNIQTLTEQLKSLQYRNCRLQKENDFMKDRRNKSKQNDIELAISEVTIKSSVEECLTDEDNKEDCNIKCKTSQYKMDHENGFDLSPHLTTVKKLLHCQDALLRDLKSLSDEFLNNN